MKKKLIVLMLSMSMTAALVSGCGSTAETAVESTATETVQETATEAETADAESDQEAADKVAALIDQIYVQERNDNTDEQCAEAHGQPGGQLDNALQTVEPDRKVTPEVEKRHKEQAQRHAGDCLLYTSDAADE